MTVESTNGRATIKQNEVTIPDLTIKDLLGAIPYVHRQPPVFQSGQLISFHHTVRTASNAPPFVRRSTCMVPASSSTTLLTRNFRRSAWDCTVIGCAYKAATFLDAFITPEAISLPHPVLYPVARLSLWSLYGFWTGLFATGLWVVAHECGHQAFSESKFINNSVGWVLHSAFVSCFFSYLCHVIDTTRSKFEIAG